MTKNEFLETISKLVIKENNKRNNPLFSSVVIAQAILESGWGQSKMMMKANAIFGIKATTNWKGKVYNSKTQECYDGSNYTEIVACFRAYNSLEESISDYFNLICTSSRYRKALTANTPLQCITEIKNGGYATDPNYINSIMKIIKLNNLTKYDVENVENSVDNFYIIGNVYTLQVNLNVRYGAGTQYNVKKYIELSIDGKKHALNNEKAILKKGTRVTCLDIIPIKNEIWLKIPSGYICGNYRGKVYVK